MSLIFLTPVLIRHRWQLKTVIFLHWCNMCCSIDLFVALRITIISLMSCCVYCSYAKCPSSERRYGECRGAHFAPHFMDILEVATEKRRKRFEKNLCNFFLPFSVLPSLNFANLSGSLKKGRKEFLRCIMMRNWTLKSHL